MPRAGRRDRRPAPIHESFDPFEIDFDRCRDELGVFRALLAEFSAGTLKERDHVLKFFREHRNLAALIGHKAPHIARVDRVAYEFDFFGDYAADLALGNSRKRVFCFVEFENAAPDSIFRKVGKKASLEWAPRFDHGYSQVLDWFWKLNDLHGTEAAAERFGHATKFDFIGLLIMGRSGGLSEVELGRLQWRRSKVVVNSKQIYCMTFDELGEDLAFILDKYAHAAADSATLPKPKKRTRRRNPFRRGTKSG